VVAAVATPLIEPVPIAALGVVVIAAVMGMLDVGGVWRLRRVHPAEVGLAMATLLGVLILGVLGGLLVAIGLSIGVYVYRSIRPHDAILGAVHDVDGYHDIDAFPAAETIPGLIVYRFDAPLFFPNAPYFKERVIALVAAAETPTRWVLINAEAITYIDTTGVATLRELRADLAGAGILLTVARAWCWQKIETAMWPRDLRSPSGRSCWFRRDYAGPFAAGQEVLDGLHREEGGDDGDQDGRGL